MTSYTALFTGCAAGFALGMIAFLLLLKGRIRAERAAAEAAVRAEMKALEVQRDGALQERDLARTERLSLQEKLTITGERASAAESAAKQLGRQLDELKGELAARQATEDELRSGMGVKDSDLSRLTANLASERQQSAEKLKLLTEARDQLKADFQNLAGAIFDEKNRTFTAQSRENLELMLAPLKDQLGMFRKRMDEVHESTATGRQQLSEQIKMLMQMNEKVSKDAGDLARALKSDSKKQGDWGELVLERALELSGLQEGREFEHQHTSTTDSGTQARPDVVVHLPDKKVIIIDSKVSLTAFTRMVNAGVDEQRDAALKEHILSIRKHIDELAKKTYDLLPGLYSQDFVLMFVPLEGAFVAAIREVPELFEEAYRKHVILICPSTLLVTLRTIANMWDVDRQKQNTEKIVRRATALYEKFAGFVENLLKVRAAIETAANACDDAARQLSTGKGNLVRSVEAMRELGLKPRKAVPDAVSGDEEDDEELPPAPDAVALP